MRRRNFLEVVGGAAAGGARWPGIFRSPGRRADFRAWTWVHGTAERSPTAWRTHFARLRAAGITGVLVEGGNPDILSAAAKAEGVAYHRWIWILNRPGDTWAQENRPEWFSVSRRGESSLTYPPYVGYYKWVCPSRQPVRDYLRGIIREAASHPGVDGVHLDYIRHPDVILPVGLWAKYNLVQDREHPEFDFCYCAVCREAFQAQSGTDPLELPDPTTSQAWREFRWNSVTQVVRELAEEANGAGKQITAAVFPTPSLARTLVRQAWEQWPLDAVFPMLYHGFYLEDPPWVGTSVREGVAALPAARPLNAGLYLPDLDPATLGRTVRIAREAGAAGVSFFESNGLTDAHLAALTRELI